MIRALTLLLILPFASFSQNFGYMAGGRSAALAHSSVALTDVWAVHHNQAALGFLEKTTVGISYENRFFLPDLSLGNAAFAMPTNLGTVGLSFSYFGFELYNESKFGLNYARAFGKYFSMGLQINYHSYNISEGSGSDGAVTFEAGLLARPIKKLQIGFHVFNPSTSQKNAETEERLPLIVRLGAQYKIGDEVSLTAEVKKNENTAERYALGFEYQIVEKIVLRTGVGLQPLTNTFGVGLNLGSFSTHLSYEYAQVLGSNGNISLQYSF